MSVMSVSTVTCPLASTPIRAPDLATRLLRKAVATPMPTSQRPSRTCPGLGLRRFQPKRAAPSRRHSTSFRLEKGRCGPASGSYCTSLRMRSSTGSTPHASASRSEEHTSELQSLMRLSYAVFCLKKKKHKQSQRYSYEQQ